MTKVQNPITGRSKGQAGGMVFTTLFGANIIKAKPYSYRDANTLVQRANRNLHVSLVRAAASMKTISRYLFLQQPASMSAYSKTVQQLQALYNRSTGSPVFDPDTKEIGSGNVELELSVASYVPGTGVFEVTIVNSSDLNLPDGATSSHDLLIFDSTTNEIERVTGVLTHATGVFTATSLKQAPVDDSCWWINYSNSKSGADLVKNVKRATILQD